LSRLLCDITAAVALLMIAGGPENGLVRQETFKMIIRSEVVGCGCRSELTATITTVVSR